MYITQQHNSTKLWLLIASKIRCHLWFCVLWCAAILLSHPRVMISQALCDISSWLMISHSWNSILTPHRYVKPYIMPQLIVLPFLEQWSIYMMHEYIWDIWHIYDICPITSFIQVPRETIDRVYKVNRCDWYIQWLAIVYISASIKYPVIFMRDWEVPASSFCDGVIFCSLFVKYENRSFLKHFHSPYKWFTS